MFCYLFDIILDSVNFLLCILLSFWCYSGFFKLSIMLCYILILYWILLTFQYQSEYSCYIGNLQEGIIYIIKCITLSRFQIWKLHICTFHNQSQSTKCKYFQIASDEKFNVTQMSYVIHQINQNFEENSALETVFAQLLYSICCS